MPTYSYQCKRCDHTQDLFHPMSASPRVKCEMCGGPCQRLIGKGAGIIFKGSGFYETDYKQKGKAPASDTSSEKSAAAKGASEKKNDQPKTNDSSKSAPAKAS